MQVFTKRGLSPVIATTLLVAITLVLAVIVFFWARSFIGESIEKEGRAVETSCENVDFLAEAHTNQLFIQNIGGVPIYALEIRVEGPGEIKEVGQTGSTIGPGQSASFNLPQDAQIGDTIRAVPILLGETEDERVSHVCDPTKYYVEAEYVY